MEHCFRSIKIYQKANEFFELWVYGSIFKTESPYLDPHFNLISFSRFFIFQAESLNNLVGEAFRIAYAQQRALMDNRKATAAQTQTSSSTSAAVTVSNQQPDETNSTSALPPSPSHPAPPTQRQSIKQLSPPSPKSKFPAPRHSVPLPSHKHAITPAEVDSGINTADINTAASFQMKNINVGCGYMATGDSGLRWVLIIDFLASSTSSNRVADSYTHTQFKAWTTHCDSRDNFI